MYRHSPPAGPSGHSATGPASRGNRHQERGWPHGGDTRRQWRGRAAMTTTPAEAEHTLPLDPDKRDFTAAFIAWINSDIDNGLEFEAAVARCVERVASAG